LKSKQLLNIAPRFLHGLLSVVIMARHLATTGVLEAFAHQMRLVRGLLAQL
jgi:hypothetical protein